MAKQEPLPRADYMDPFIGMILGNYRIQDYLDEGGMADLYLGQHIRLEISAAIKILKAKMAQNDKYRLEFEEEARRIAHLDHPHIVRILDCGYVDDRPYLIMPLAKGSLKDTQGTILPLETIVRYVKQIAEALEYAHRREIVHRDNKPANFLIGSREEILLSDFGIATVTQSVRVNQQEVIGTPHYMPPEQWQGGARRASDQYALGIVVYQWLCGEVPFQGSIEQLMWAHLQKNPPSFREKGVQIPPEVEEVVMRALAKVPEQRFKSVQEFAEALEGCVKPTKQPVALTPQPWYKPRWRDLLAVLLTAGLYLVIVWFATASLSSSLGDVAGVALWILPFVMGILAVDSSRREGFDGLVPALISGFAGGCVYVSIATALLGAVPIGDVLFDLLIYTGFSFLGAIIYLLSINIKKLPRLLTGLMRGIAKITVKIVTAVQRLVIRRKNPNIIDEQRHPRGGG